MKSKSYLAALLVALLNRGALAHQTHGILLVNGTATPVWKYVRDVGDAWDDPGWPAATREWLKTVPQLDIYHPGMTCGREAFKSAPTTETADVLAGSEVGFRVSWDADHSPIPTFYHTGPGQVYLSRAPDDDLEHYRGDGDWFKIAKVGAVGKDEWYLWDKREFNFTIPLTTPPGKYLMRFEQIYPTPSYNYSQWFINCAHVNIMGPGGGTPTGFAKFPGTYEITDPGLQIPESVMAYNGHPKNRTEDDMGALAYQFPGPPVWTG